MNLYAYAGNNPISYDDPYGLVPVEEEGGCCLEGGQRAAMQVVQAVVDKKQHDDAEHYANTAGYSQSAMLFYMEANSSDGGIPLGTGVRYMGPAEAQTVGETHTIPATNAQGEPKDIHYTTDEPVNSGQTAKTRYNLPSTPTHYSTFPLSRVQNHVSPRGSVAADASQAATSRPIPGASTPIPLPFQ